jgi:hypothetical protein
MSPQFFPKFDPTMDAHGALPPGPPFSSGGGHKWQISATTRDTATTPVNASMVIHLKRLAPSTVPRAQPGAPHPGACVQAHRRSYKILYQAPDTLL